MSLPIRRFWCSSAWQWFAGARGRQRTWTWWLAALGALMVACSSENPETFAQALCAKCSACYTEDASWTDDNCGRLGVVGATASSGLQAELFDSTTCVQNATDRFGNGKEADLDGYIIEIEEVQDAACVSEFRRLF